MSRTPTFALPLIVYHVLDTLHIARHLFSERADNVQQQPVSGGPQHQHLDRTGLRQSNRGQDYSLGEQLARLLHDVVHRSSCPIIHAQPHSSIVGAP